MSILINREESKRIFDKLTEEDIRRAISVLSDRTENYPLTFTTESHGYNAYYSLQFHNERLRSVTIKIDSNLEVSCLGGRGEDLTVGNAYFFYKELFAIIAEKNL